MTKLQHNTASATLSQSQDHSVKITTKEIISKLLQCRLKKFSFKRSLCQKKSCFSWRTAERFHNTLVTSYPHAVTFKNELPVHYKWRSPMNSLSRESWPGVKWMALDRFPGQTTTLIWFSFQSHSYCLPGHMWVSHLLLMAFSTPKCTELGPALHGTTSICILKVPVGLRKTFQPDADQ